MCPAGPAPIPAHSAPRFTPRHVALLFLALATGCADEEPAGGIARRDIDRMSRAVVQIVALQGGAPVSTGSGTLVDRTGRIFTNRHVVEGADDYEIRMLDDPSELPVPRYRAALVGYSLDIDFAVLQVDRDAGGDAVVPSRLRLPHLQVRGAEAQRGDPLFVFGYPGIAEGYQSLTNGTVTTIRTGSMGGRRLPVWYQTDAEISPGNSGGLAVDARSRIVGIPTTVLSEERTGGRMGGILAVGAVEAALAQGLEVDPSRMSDGTVSPVLADGRLDVARPPFYGSVALAPGFGPDPYSVDVVSGGEVAASYLGGSCVGHAAVAPDYRLNWAGGGQELRIFFEADDGGDATLLVNLPDGSWACNDDSAIGVRDPLLVLATPAAGQYDIWVGSYVAGTFVGGTLRLTGGAGGPGSARALELRPDDPPFFGAATVVPGGFFDPFIQPMVTGGPVPLAELGGSCVGYASSRPDFQLQWSGVVDTLRILFEKSGEGDPVLAVRSPTGGWLCNDDHRLGTLNPMVTIPMAFAGRYDIWVGSYSQESPVNGNLRITSQAAEPR